jgi:hypothetical protein
MKLNKRFWPAAGFMVAAAMAACASRGGGEASRASFQRNLGTASLPDAMERVPRVLRLFNYEINREETTPNITIETHWRERVPFVDEQNQGIVKAENRVLVSGRVRAATQFGNIYTLDLAIDNRVRMGENPDWVETSATPMYRAYADSLVKHIQRELTIGVRKY